MGTRSSGSITQLLEKWSRGDEKALDQLLPLVYDELHRIAEGYLRRERREHTLQPTALVNELFLKFFDQNSMSWQNRAHFFGVAAQIMRRILVDHARAHYSIKRGGDRLAVSLQDVAAFGSQPDADLLAVHDVLNRLEKIDPVQGRIVELRFFGGLTVRETAEVMQTSHMTIEREWRIAKAFLKRELTRAENVSTTTSKSAAAISVTDEKKLAEAWSNRELLTTLMSESWAGLRLLVRLRLSPYTEPELVSAFEIEAGIVNSLIRRLEEFGALEKRNAGFTLTKRGRVLLENFEKAIGNSLTE